MRIFTGRCAVAASSAALPLLLLAAPAVIAAPTPIPVGTPPDPEITLPSTVYAGIPVTLSGADSTADGGVAQWEWDLGGDGGYERSSTSSPWTTRTFKAGRRSVGLRVTSSAGLVASTTRSFRVRKAPAASVEPSAPVGVTADADGATITVRWSEPAGASALAYRVINADDPDADPVYVAADGPAEVELVRTVPGTYRVRVAGVNAVGAGPSTTAEATVVSKAAPTASATASPTPAAPQDPTSSPSGPAVADAGADDDRRGLVGAVMIGAGALLLVGAGGIALLGRRRRAAPG